MAKKKKEPLALLCLSCDSTFLRNANGKDGRPSCPVCAEEIDLADSSAERVDCSSCTRTINLGKLRMKPVCPFCEEKLDVTALLSDEEKEDFGGKEECFEEDHEEE